MKRKHIPLIICITGMVSFILVFTLRSSSNNPASPGIPPQTTAVPPEHIAYLFLFRSNASFRKMASEAGKPNTANPMILKEAKLNDLQTRRLDEITEDTLREVDQQDARARIIIEKFRAQYSNGKIPKGQKLAEPPPELLVMQQEKNAIVLRGRDRLRAALGEQEFARFHDFVMKKFASNVQANKERQQ